MHLRYLIVAVAPGQPPSVTETSGNTLFPGLGLGLGLGVVVPVWEVIVPGRWFVLDESEKTSWRYSLGAYRPLKKIFKTGTNPCS